MSSPPSDVERITDELIKFTCPERIEFSSQGRHALRFQAVVLEPSLSPAGHQPNLGQHTKMLRYRRPAHREVAGKLGHRSFSVAQQLQQLSPARLGHRGYQVWHHNTLVTTNTSGNPNQPCFND
jgi:hypothetical protein